MSVQQGVVVSTKTTHEVRRLFVAALLGLLMLLLIAEPALAASGGGILPPCGPSNDGEVIPDPFLGGPPWNKRLQCKFHDGRWQWRPYNPNSSLLSCNPVINGVAFGVWSQVGDVTQAGTDPLFGTGAVAAASSVGASSLATKQDIEKLIGSTWTTQVNGVWIYNTNGSRWLSSSSTLTSWTSGYFRSETNLSYLGGTSVCRSSSLFLAP